MSFDSQSPSLGADLRALRKARKITLEVLAEVLGKSVGWLSQVERGISEPSYDELKALAAHYEVPLSMLFGQAIAPVHELGRVVRKDARRKVGNTQASLVEELLSPDLTDSFEVIHSTFQPGSKSDAPITRPTQEVGYLISGQLNIWLDEQEFLITPGDSFRIRKQTLRWENPFDIAAVAIWVISPPVY
ncbi:MAG: XRE family transcriptional regulator [Pseudoruegeria sp.]